MSHWLDICDDAATPCVLVTVAAVDGSGPRETGAKMIVTAEHQFDTIGGGHLEMRACEMARQMLDAVDGMTLRRVERFALGPSLGQCCGGVVYLAFEVIDEDARDDMRAMRARLREREDTWRMIPIDEFFPTFLITREGQSIARPDSPARGRGELNSTVPWQGQTPPLHFSLNRPCHILRDSQGHRWLIDPCLAPRPHLVLFGAGHVGAAIIRALADLPCHVTWVDEREDMFPVRIPANVQVEATDTPETIAVTAVAGSTFLVLTHSHTLDQRLAEHILRRPGNDWFGLIGSRTKRMQFERRLGERGIAREKLDAMVCPIGIPGIGGKEPAVIAAAVTAQLLQVWEAAARNAAGLESQAVESPVPTGKAAA